MSDQDRGSGLELSDDQLAALQQWGAAAAAYTEADQLWRKATDARAAAVLALRESGLSLSEIGALTGLDRAQVVRLAKKAAGG